MLASIPFAAFMRTPINFQTYFFRTHNRTPGNIVFFCFSSRVSLHLFTNRFKIRLSNFKDSIRQSNGSISISYKLCINRPCKLPYCEVNSQEFFFASCSSSPRLCQLASVCPSPFSASIKARLWKSLVSVEVVGYSPRHPTQK